MVLAIDVLALLHELSKLEQTWRMEHAATMQGVLQAAATTVYCSIAYLIRPHWLAVRLEQCRTTTISYFGEVLLVWLVVADNYPAFNEFLLMRLVIQFY